MAYDVPRSAGFGGLLSTMVAAVQWRLLAVWLVIMLIPATVVTLPLWRMLSGLLDGSTHAAEWARHFSAMMFTDVIFALADHAEWFGVAAIIGLALTLLLSPFLDGMIVGSGRAGRVLGFGELLHNGLLEYGRMFLLMLWSLLPYALVVAVAVGSSHRADKYAETAMLESQVDVYSNAMRGIALLVFVLIQSIVESARAAFIADVALRSAMCALWRGLRQLFRRPWKTLLFYLAVTLAGTALVSLFSVARIRVTAFGLSGLLLALALNQLIVLAIGWMRTARLFALADVARTLVPMQQQSEHQ
ncbi:hypothetical protein [Dyella choica]|uniref:Uncharacterized protein n=1 Tax=Dyella choica TaxID=1927959 RepID=A0A3S0WUP7_9GAMM|nr:hypothetical protein [Dyella choica]RUL73658.1 hypothetical protein EKH80_15195 [Dyella choica]